jgi:asparagine synthase (glutamine-hydrolysing)
MKESLADVLPGDILNRKKRGFGTPMGAWLKGALAPLMRQLLSRESIERRGLLCYPTVEKLMRAHDANRIDGTDRLLALLNLEIWARLYLDARSHEDVVDELKLAA